MNLATFRRLTAHLPGDLEMLCAGTEVCVLWHDKNHVSIDDGLLELDETHVVLHGRYVNSDGETHEVDQQLAIGAAHSAATADECYRRAQEDDETRSQ